jgi:hypothetical protein
MSSGGAGTDETDVTNNRRVDDVLTVEVGTVIGEGESSDAAGLIGLAAATAAAVEVLVLDVRARREDDTGAAADDGEIFFSSAAAGGSSGGLMGVDILTTVAAGVNKLTDDVKAAPVPALAPVVAAIPIRLK